MYSNVTNTTLNRGATNFDHDTTEVDTDKDEIKFYSKMHMGTIFKIIKRLFPEADIDSIKNKIRNICIDTVRAFRPSIEARQAEMFDLKQHPELNYRGFHVIGVDLMIDTNFDLHLFEVNRYPLQVPSYKHLIEGKLVDVRSKTNET